MNKHSNEEHGVEVGDNGRCSDNGTPSEAHGPIGNIIWFARILPPTAGKQTVTMRRLNESWILNRVPRQLRERLAEVSDALSLHLEVTLLCHRSIPTTQNALAIMTIQPG